MPFFRPPLRPRHRVLCATHQPPISNIPFHDEYHWSVLLSGLKNRHMTITIAFKCTSEELPLSSNIESCVLSSNQSNRQTDTLPPKPMLHLSRLFLERHQTPQNTPTLHDGTSTLHLTPTSLPRSLAMLQRHTQHTAPRPQKQP